MAKKKSSRKRAKVSSNDCQSRSDRRLRDSLSDSDAHFHKGLSHSSNTGEVDRNQFKYLVDQLRKLNANPKTHAKKGFQLRKRVSDDTRNFVNPQSGWATDTEISDPCCFEIPVPPALHSTATAAEAIEDYWMALLRDIPFIEWGNHVDVAEAASELSEYPLFINAQNPNGDPNEVDASFQSIGLTHKSVFRGGELKRFSNQNAGISESVGPFISQFLLHEIPYGTLRIPQRFIHATPGVDYITDWSEWLSIQNGEKRDAKMNLIGEAPTQACQRRYLSTMRDLATYVHFDQLYQAYLNAALILLGNGYPVNRGNPYGPGCTALGSGQDQRTDYRKRADALCRKNDSEPHCKPLYPDQDGFTSHGGPHLLSLVSEVATRALKAVWRQKWTLLRLRPEAYGGLVERALGTSQTAYDRFPQDVRLMLSQSEAIQRTRGGFHGCVWQSSGNALLPLAYPEGSPTHPAYGAGHATVAGACVTVLKAFMNGAAEFANPMQASACGSQLVRYTDSDACEMTVESELNKLAANISVGRDMAGVHWRSDYTQSVLLGQRVAIDMLCRMKDTYTETWAFEFNSFGGVPITIDASGATYCSDTGHVHVDKGTDSCQVAEKLKQFI